MAWHNYEVAGWKDLEKLLESLESIAVGWRTADDVWSYRGQADAAWGLKDSLTRALRDSVSPLIALKIEKELAERFKEQAHLFLDPHTLPQSQDTLEWWPLMQHFGAPTRVLDWTLSPYIAVYFAVVDLWDRPGAVWLFQETRLQSGALKVMEQHGVLGKGKELNYFSVDSPECMLPDRQRSYPSIRVITQQGRFTTPFRILSDHGTLIDRLIGDEGTAHFKIVIVARAKPEILRRLSQMNITANSLFPGLDGLGRSLKEYAKLRCMWPGLIGMHPDEDLAFVP